jgi:hypothetical protein
LLIKAKQQHGKNEYKNTGLFEICMDFVVVRTKQTKKNRNFFCHAWVLCSIISLDFLWLKDEINVAKLEH